MTNKLTYFVLLILVLLLITSCATPYSSSPTRVPINTDNITGDTVLVGEFNKVITLSESFSHGIGERINKWIEEHPCEIISITFIVPSSEHGFTTAVIVYRDG